MRRSKTIPLSEAIQDYVKAMKFDEKLEEIGLISSWEEIVGKAISSRTRKIYIKDHVLFVHLSSSVVRSELMMLKQALIEKLNGNAGRKIITDIIFR